MVDIKKIKQKTAQIKSSMEDKPTIYKAPYIPIAKRGTKAQKFNEKEYKTSPEQAAWSNFISSVGGGLISKAARGTTDAEEKYGSSVVNLPTITKIDRERHPVASTIGTLAGEAVKYGTATKALSYAAKGGGVAAKLAGKGIGSRLAAGRVIDLPVDLVNAAVETDNAGDFAKRLGIDTAIGIGADLTFEGIGRLFKGLKSIKQAKGNLSKEAISETVEKVTKETAETATGIKKTPQALPVKQVDDISTFGKNTAGAAERKLLSHDSVGAATNPYKIEQKVSKVRSNTFERSGIFSEAEKNLDGLKMKDMTYDVVTEKESMARAAQRIANDIEGEKADLLTKQFYTGEDLDTAMGVLSDEVQKAQKSGDYSEVVKVSKAVREKGTQGGQFIQAFAKYTRTPEGIMVKSFDTIDKLKIKPELKKKVLNNVARFSEALKTLKENDKDGLIDIIIKQAKERKTKVSKTTIKALKSNDFQYLYDFALTQYENIATDYTKISFGKKISTIQAISHLLNIPTSMRNITSNQIFDVIDGGLANNMSMLPDSIMSMFTKRKTIGLNKSWISKAKREGAKKGFLKSYAETALDVDMGVKSTRYGIGSKRTFKAVNNKVLSTIEKSLGFELVVPDEMHKGSVRAEVLESLSKLVKNGDITSEQAKEWADDEALYRAFQDDNLPNKILANLKDALNTIGIGDSGRTLANSKVKIRDFGIGDLTTKYTQVLGSLISRTVEFSPAGYIKAIAAMAQAAKVGGLEAAAQRKIALAIGRATTGTGLIAAFYALSKAGLMSRADEEDNADIIALNSAEGIQGTQINMSGLSRWLDGDNPTRQMGDVLMSVDFLEPINGLMTVGTLIAQDTSNNSDATKYIKQTLNGIFMSVMDMPVMQNMNSVMNVIRYHDEDSELPLALQIPIELAQSNVTGFIPAPIRQLAQSTDLNYREQYLSKDSGLQTKDKIMNSLPIVRQKLPEKLDNFGRVKKYGDNNILNAFNSLFFPGRISIYKQDEVSKELQDLRKSTGQTNIYPSRKPPYEVKQGGNVFALTGEKRQEYQKTRGQSAYSSLRELFKTEAYKKMSNDARAKTVRELILYANDLAKTKILSGNSEFEPSSIVTKIEEAKKQNIKISDFILTKHQINPDADDTSETIKKLIPLLPENQQQLATATSDSASDVKRLLIFNKDLTPEQKSTLDKLLVGELKNPRDYSSEDAFILSGLSEAKQKRYPEVKSRWGNITPSEYALILDGIKGLKRKDEIISKLMEIGFSEAGAYRFYNVAIK